LFEAFDLEEMREDVSQSDAGLENLMIKNTAEVVTYRVQNISLMYDSEISGDVVCNC